MSYSFGFWPKPGISVHLVSRNEEPVKRESDGETAEMGKCRLPTDHTTARRERKKKELYPRVDSVCFYHLTFQLVTFSERI